MEGRDINYDWLLLKLSTPPFLKMCKCLPVCAVWICAPYGVSTHSPVQEPWPPPTQHRTHPYVAPQSMRFMCPVQRLYFFFAVLGIAPCNSQKAALGIVRPIEHYQEVQNLFATSWTQRDKKGPSRPTQSLTSFSWCWCLVSLVLYWTSFYKNTMATCSAYTFKHGVHRFLQVGTLYY